MGKPEGKCLAVIRLRGRVGVKDEVEDALRMLHLTRENHATLIDDRETYLGSLKKVKDYVTWGEVSRNTVLFLLKKRGRVHGGKRLTDEYVREKLGLSGIEELSEAIYSSKIEFNKIPGIKPVFRLRPPKGGFKRSKKRHYPDGELGFRGEAINSLLVKMA